jgi:TRAP-type mannitol/chloroaromatic compound transport system permease large subunit
MSVWTTLSESQTAEADVEPGPRPTTTPLLAPYLGPDPGRQTVDVPSEPPAVAGRLALRQARRKRQLTAAVCVVVVAVLLALTIMILGIARDRPATPASSGAAASAGPTLLAPSL